MAVTADHLADHLTPRSQRVWSEQVRATGRRSSDLARAAGITTRMLNRQLASRSGISTTEARAVAEAAGLTVRGVGLHAFVLGLPTPTPARADQPTR